MNKADNFVTLGLIGAIFLGPVVALVALLTAPDADRWEKIDNAGNCYVHIEQDNRFVRGTVAEKRRIYCVDDKEKK